MLPGEIFTEDLTSVTNVGFTVKTNDGGLIFRSWSLAEAFAMDEAQEAGSATVEVRYPSGGGHIIRYTKKNWGIEKEYLPRDWEV